MKKRIKALVAIFCIVLTVYAPGDIGAREPDAVVEPYPYLNAAALEELVGHRLTARSGTVFGFREGQFAVYIPHEFMYIGGERGMFVVFVESDEYGVRLITKHDVLDLVQDEQIHYEIAAAFDGGNPHEWEVRGGRHFAPRRNRIYIQTVDNVRYGFEITTGEIMTTDFIYRHSPDMRERPTFDFNITPRQGATIGISILAASVLVVVFLYFLESW